MIIRKRVAGRVEYNEGDFAEIQTVGTEGIDEDLLLDRFQIDRYDTKDTPKAFKRRFPVGMWLDVSTTIEVGPKKT